MSFDPTSAALDYDEDADSIFDPSHDPLTGLPSSGVFVDAQDGTGAALEAEEEEDDEEEEDPDGQADQAYSDDLPMFSKR